MMRKLLSTVTLTALALGLTGAFAPANAQRPIDDSTDEAGMWYQVDKIENQVKTSGLRITDPTLVAYAEKLTCEVVGPNCNQLRVYIINAPVFNASMYPNGMMLINSGLLLRSENGAQVGCVIGHEYGHYNEKHSLERWRSAKAWGNVLMFGSMAAGAAGAGEATLAGSFIALAAQQSYSRKQESEADKVGFDLIADAGFVSSECSDVWGGIITELENSSFKKTRKRAKQKSPGVFSSHPVSSARQATLLEYAKTKPGGALVQKAEHDAATRQFLGEWLKTELLAKDYDRHIYLFNELKARGRNPAIIDYYIGEAYRLRKGAGDRELAVAAWESSAAQTGAPSQVHRSLAEHYRRTKRTADAIKSYKQYLALTPNAPDQELIEAYIVRLESTP